jgi:ATPase subunit of ABC transporter with duplicated ATPase domains
MSLSRFLTRQKDNDKPLYDDVRLTIRNHDKLLILGSNGSGKTTLLKIIMKEIAPSSGTVFHNSETKIGYVPQELEDECKKQTVLDYLKSYTDSSDMDHLSKMVDMLYRDEGDYKNR